jgi:hypothetical protein
MDRAKGNQLKAKPAEKPAPKAAEAKIGHNQPPEQTEKFDLKKRPSEQPRSEGGRFGSKQPPPEQGEIRRGHFDAQAGVQTAKGVTGTQPAQGQSYPSLPSHAPFAQPPARMAESAKRDWAATPETVRGDIHRLQSEFAKAYQFYRADHEAFKPLKQYHQLAQQQGTTLEKAMGNYMGIEETLRRNPIEGLNQIIHNLNLVDPQTGKRIDIRDVSYTVLSQTPEQLQMMQQGNVQTAASNQIGALHQEVKGLKTALNQMHNQQQFVYTRSAVDQFAESHPRLDDEAFGEIVKREIQLGFDLPTAYRRAELLQPATHAEQIRTTPAQTRPPDRSISGAPAVAPSNGAARRPKEPSPTPQAAVQRAMRAMNGAL